MLTSFIKRLKTVLMLSCDQSSRLVSDSQERGLLRHERLALWLHMLSCKGCRRMREQFCLLKQVAKRARSGEAPSASHLPAEGRERIEQGLKNS